MAREGNRNTSVLPQHVLLSVTEELKLPLLQIARQAEHGRLHGAANLDEIQASADTALRLLDNYSLGLQLNADTEHLETEPVSVSSVLYDTGQQLDKLAKSYGVELELNVAGRFHTVMAHRRGLQAALSSLGASMIEALPAIEGTQLKLQLATHRSRYGVVAGLYTDNNRLTTEALQRGRHLLGRSRQPLLHLSHSSGAGVFVADAILKAMDLRLKASRHHRLYGLATILPLNPQLHFLT